jgi:hypothetical protein
MQASIDAGEVVTYYRLRAVMPAGTSAPCDVVSISMYPGLPSEPPDREQMQARFKKAGLASSPEDSMARRDAARTVVSYQMFQNQSSLGTIKKGDYLAVSYMKTPNIGEWLKMETTIWKPLAEALIKDGVQSSWSVNVLVMPGGDDAPYQGVSVDGYPSLAAALKAQWPDPNMDARFKRVHPGMDFDTTIEKALKTRSQSLVYLYQVEDELSARQ